jgi:predicted PhzF superfamily epimerase YddE/YHI9
MNFPAEPATSCESPNGLAKALGAEILWCGQNRMDHLVKVATEQTLLDLRPDFANLARLDTRGVIVTAAAERDNVDFVSRFFCPVLGIDEDPVTGSAHCCLAPFWAERLGRVELTGFQASKRGGFVRCEVIGDRVDLSGRGVKIFSGTMSAQPAGA